MPENLAFGKHYFYVSLLDTINQEYKLRPNSRILFELKSINNVVLKSDIVSISQRNGVATCFVEILKDPLRTFKEVEDGGGFLTIVGSLEDKQNTETPIPDKFVGAMNYRCSFPIQISKNILNANSPFVLNTEHKTATTKGQFSFAKASISPLKKSKSGIIYNNSGNPTGRLTPSPSQTLDEKSS